MDTIGTRLRMVRFSITPKPSEAKFAESLGTTRSALHEYEKDRVIPNDTFLQLVASKFDVNYNWLKTGEGEMREETEGQILDAVVARYNLDENQKRILEVFLYMDPEKRQDVSDSFFTFLEEFNKGQLTADQIKGEQEVVRRGLEIEKKVQRTSGVPPDVDSVSSDSHG